MSSESKSEDLIAKDVNETNIETQELIDKAADLILSCRAILFTTGAGMGVNSGFDTYRVITPDVWPPLLQHPELTYSRMCNPRWFRKPQGNNSNIDTASFGYGFWTCRYNTYKSGVPHHGYHIAKEWSELSHIKSAFSFTSNIDGHWIKSGWNELSLVECHGSIDYMQCVNNCSNSVWSTNDTLNLSIDPDTNCVIDPLPLCPTCNDLARPNVLMFDDHDYSGKQIGEQIARYREFKANVAVTHKHILIIEIGAGKAVPTVRHQSELVFISSQWTADFIRINPLVEHSKIDVVHRARSKGQAIELSIDALTALTLIDEAVKTKMKRSKTSRKLHCCTTPQE